MQNEKIENEFETYEFSHKRDIISCNNFPLIFLEMLEKAESLLNF